ncbi:MAG: SGNH hydrolase domain-containing protein, partial [Cyanobium sp.]
TRSMQLDQQGRHIHGEPAKLAYYQAALSSLAQALAGKGASLLIVADVPRFLALKVDRNLCVKQWFRPWLPASCQQPLQQSLAAHRADTAPMARLLATLETNHTNVHVFDPAAVLCADGVCRSHDGAGELLYRDRDHLSERGAWRLAEPLGQFLQTRGLLSPGASPQRRT